MVIAEEEGSVKCYECRKIVTTTSEELLLTSKLREYERRQKEEESRSCYNCHSRQVATLMALMDHQWLVRILLIKIVQHVYHLKKANQTAAADIKKNAMSYEFPKLGIPSLDGG